MPAAGLDEDGVARPHGVALAVEFHFALAFKNVINLSEPLVIVRAGIGRDVDDMQRNDAVDIIDKRPPRFAARAFRGRKITRSRDLKSLCHIELFELTAKDAKKSKLLS